MKKPIIIIRPKSRPLAVAILRAFMVTSEWTTFKEDN